MMLNKNVGIVYYFSPSLDITSPCVVAAEWDTREVHWTGIVISNSDRASLPVGYGVTWELAKENLIMKTRLFSR